MHTSKQAATFTIAKQNLSDARWLEHDIPILESKQILLRIDKVGLSSNNITYAVTGANFGYWGFFPNVEDDQRGIMPMWGFANVVASMHPDVEEGKRVFGYFPSSTHWVMTPEKVTRHGYIDGHPIRKSNAPVYDSYLFCDADAVYDTNREAWQANFRPLFLTSFVLSEFVAAQTKHQTTTILLTSASSKTAYGCAYLLQKLPNVEVVGITSPANVDFVQELGCYDDIIEYDAIHNLRYTHPVWILDFAGNKALLQNLQEILDSHHQHTAFIGVTDVKAQTNKPHGKLKGSVFFAPEHVKQMTHIWGRELFLAKYYDAWQGVATQLNSILELQVVNERDDFADEYQRFLAGEVNPHKMLWCQF